METLKSIFFSIIILLIVGAIGYWAFNTLQSGSEHVVSQKVKDLDKENNDLKDQIRNLTNEVSDLESKLEDLAKENEVSQNSTAQVSDTTPASYKYQSLINELDKLIKDNINIKLKSSGTRVGTVQKFLNVYNNTSTKVDNDYGAGTEKLVIAFQKDMGLTSDGEAGPGTFSKMIDWLKKQG